MSLVDKAQAQKILNEHNCLRKRHGLQPMTWDWKLAADAQVHADRCIWQHASKIGKAVRGQGENMSVAMGRPVNVQGWIDEEPFYGCTTGKCQPGKMCGHWTQMCWHNTTRVGCGIAKCASMQSAPGFMNSEFLVCRYTPQGNYVGRRPMNDDQCALGAANKTCGASGSTTAVSMAPKTTTTSAEMNPLPSATVTDATTQTETEEVPVVDSTVTIGSNSAFDQELRRVAAIQAEQQRIARLLQASGVERRQNFPVPAANEPKSEANTSSYQPALSEVPVVDKPDFVASSEQRQEERVNFTILLALFIVTIIVAVLGFAVFLTFRYRKKLFELSKISTENLKKRFNFKTINK